MIETLSGGQMLWKLEGNDRVLYLQEREGWGTLKAHWL